MSDEYLSERVRAEDIILGSLGYGEDAQIVSIEKVGQGFKGRGKWADGERFDFESESELDPLEIWALDILIKLVSESKAA